MAEIKWEEAGETIGIGINKIFGFLDELLNGKIVSDLGIKIATAINKAVSTVDAAQIGRVADGFLTQILAAIDAIDWKQIGDKLNEAFKHSNIISHLIEAIKETLEAKINIKGGIFGGLFNLPPGIGKTLFVVGAALAFIIPKALGLAGAIITLGAKLSLFNGFAKALAGLTAEMAVNGLAFGKYGGVLERFTQSGLSTVNSLSIAGLLFKKNWLDNITIPLTMGMAKISTIFSQSGITGLLTGLLGSIKGVMAAVATFIAAHPAVLIAAGIGVVIAAIATLWNSSEEFRENVIALWNDYFKPTIDAIKTALSELWENHLKPFWESSLKPLLKALLKFIGDTWKTIAGILGTILLTVGTIIGGVLKVVGTVLPYITAIVGGIIDTLNAIITFIKTLFTDGWTKAWEGVKQAFSDIFANLAEVFKTPFNAVIDIINGVMRGIGKAINGIGGWVSKAKDAIKALGGKIITIPGYIVNTIPKLASGGVLESPTVAMLGEYANAKSNPEIAAPQSLLEAIVGNGNDDVISVLIPLLRQINASIEDKDFSITIGDDTIAASAQRGNKNYQRRTGKTLFGY